MIELGLGAVEALSQPGTGRVVGTYRKAAYLRVPGGLFALTTPDVPSGPLHARTDIDVTRLRVGDRVTVTPTLLEAGPLLVDLRHARTWQGEYADVGAGSIDLPGLCELAARLGGRGQGLTPAGDDRLAGILLVARMFGGPDAEADLVAIASSVRTNDIARAFLVWAARGQCIEPAHRYLATGRDEALADLIAVGHSSGTELANGLSWGARNIALHQGASVRATAVQ